MTLAGGNALVLYRLPQSAEVVYLRGKFTKVDYRNCDFENQNGFVINDFCNENCFILSPEKTEKLVAPKELNEALTDNEFSFHPANNFEISQEEYLQQLVGFKTEMAKNEVSKAILSRNFDCGFQPDIALSFQKMLDSYPKAFCYLVSSPETGTWMGASPEQLFHSTSSGEIQIHALAGTQPANNVQWDKKEQEEQAFVSDYISEKLKKSGINQFETGQVETVFAGKVAHLQTTFTLPFQSGHLNSLVKLLHPTPAVCGTPTLAAKNLILATEKHQRKFYTGFLGTLGTKLGNHLFVNLRCMEITSTGANLFVGSGITQKSNPESEWTETVLKAETMLNIICRK